MVYHIFVEGVDNIGKSTLVSTIYRLILKDHPNASILKLKFDGPMSRKPIEQYIEEMVNNKNIVSFFKVLNNISNLGTHQFIIHDRSIFGSLVYWKYRKTERPQYFPRLIKSFKELNHRVLFILLIANKDTYDRYNIKPKKDETRDFQKKELAKEISNDFVKEFKPVAEQLGKLYIFGDKQWETLTTRNTSIMFKIRRFINA